MQRKKEPERGKKKMRDRLSQRLIVVVVIIIIIIIIIMGTK